MNAIVTITLIAHSTSESIQKVFHDQSVEITHTPPTVIISADGFRSEGHHPSKVFWRGGKAESLSRITHVQMVDDHGRVILGGEICRTFNAERDVSGGMTFEIMRSDAW